MLDPDLSLFGFLDKDEAEAYLERHCILADGTKPAAFWRAAKKKLG